MVDRAQIEWEAAGALRSRRFAWGVRVAVDGYLADDQWISLEPGVERLLALRRRGADDGEPVATLTALNLAGRLRIDGSGAA